MSEDQSALDGFVNVGKVRDSHGLKGELFVVTNLEVPPPWVTQFEEFILEYKTPDENGKHTPALKKFNVKKTRPHKKGFIVKAAELETRNDSDLFKGAVFYIKESLLQTKNGEEVYLREVEGFEVFDNGILIGKIIGFSSNTAQDLLVVAAGEAEVEIPFVQDFVQSIDKENKKILMSLPEGLVNIDALEADGEKDDIGDEGDEEN